MLADRKRKQAGPTSGDWKRRGGRQVLGTSLTHGPWGFMAKQAAAFPYTEVSNVFSSVGLWKKNSYACHFTDGGRGLEKYQEF